VITPEIFFLFVAVEWCVGWHRGSLEKAVWELGGPLPNFKLTDGGGLSRKRENGVAIWNNKFNSYNFATRERCKII